MSTVESQAQARPAPSRSIPIGYDKQLMVTAGRASMELGGLGIRVNCVLPGYIDTPMSSSAPDWFRESSLQEIPLARLGTVDDITPLMVFLMADESSYISGSEFNVDGGEYGHAGVKRYSDLARQGGLDKKW